MLVRYFVFASCLLFMFLLPRTSTAIEELDKELELDLYFTEEEIVTSASRHAQDIGMSPSAITVITREDIEASGATTFADLIRLVPGLDVIIGTFGVTSQSARMERNRGNNRILLLLDGIELNVELMGFPIQEMQVCSLDEIERIEVIRGPGSFLYGSNALAGVINIITRPIPDKTSARVGISGGEINTRILDMLVSTRILFCSAPENSSVCRTEGLSFPDVM